MANYNSMDYASLAKSGFLLGLGLVTIGVGGEFLGQALFGSLPEWEHTLFLYSEGVGIVVGFFSVWVFGVALPLLE